MRNDEPARLRALLNFVCKVRDQAGDYNLHMKLAFNL
jgi:hypothetical protein